MNYLTLKNDRIRRRRARLYTALITLTLMASAAYALDLLPEVTEWIGSLLGEEVVV